jgi:hypothetical protein
MAAGISPMFRFVNIPSFNRIIVDILYSPDHHFFIQDELWMKTFLPDLSGIIIFMLYAFPDRAWQRGIFSAGLL